MKRSQQKIITVKSKILRFMRLSRRLSQSFAAEVALCSDATIGHYENGRMDTPEIRLNRLLAAYGYSYEEYLEYIGGKPIPVLSLKDECLALLNQVENEEKLRAIHTILKNLTL